MFAHIIGIPMFFIKSITMHKVQMHAGAIRVIVWFVRLNGEIILSLKLMDYLVVQTLKPYTNLHRSALFAKYVILKLKTIPHYACNFHIV